MTGEEIRKQIIKNNKIIERASRSTFVLDQRAAKALEENRKLQSQCPHKFDELGYCIYCDKEID